MKYFILLRKKLDRHIDINPLAKYTFEAIDALQQTDLEYTRIVNGWFLDYYSMPHWKTTLHPWINILNMEDKWAAIPGDGSARATYITTQDLGRFFARLMDESKWQQISYVVGNEIEFNDLVTLAERTRGESWSLAAMSTANCIEKRLNMREHRQRVHQILRQPGEAGLRKDIFRRKIPRNRPRRRSRRRSILCSYSLPGW